MSNKYEVDLNDTPVFRDGLTTQLSYAILACKTHETYNGVTYGRGNLKFYPDAQFWGITDSILNTMGVPTLYDRGTYQGIHSVSKEQVELVLERIRTQRGAVVVTKEAFANFNPSSNASRGGSRALHPATHGVPSLKSLPVRNSA